MNECQAHVHTCPFDVMQECKACHEVKPLAEYYRSVTNRDGLVSKCKRCMAQSNQRKVTSQASCVHACSCELSTNCLLWHVSVDKAGDSEYSQARLSGCTCIIRGAEVPPCTAREQNVDCNSASALLLSKPSATPVIPTKVQNIVLFVLAEVFVSAG